MITAIYADHAATAAPATAVRRARELVASPPAHTYAISYRHGHRVWLLGHVHGGTRDRVATGSITEHGTVRALVYDTLGRRWGPIGPRTQLPGALRFQSVIATGDTASTLDVLFRDYHRPHP